MDLPTALKSGIPINTEELHLWRTRTDDVISTGDETVAAANDR